MLPDLLDTIAIFGDAGRRQYIGGKSGVGVYQTIINLIPPHQVYIEPFAGGGAILRHKRPAALNIATDRCPHAITALRAAIARDGDNIFQDDETALANIATNSDDMSSSKIVVPAKWQIEVGDAFDFLTSYPFQGDEFIYRDPPYLRATLKSNRDLYKHTLDDHEHRRLLKILSKLPCRVMLSGYWSELYAEHLAGWHTETFQTRTRGGGLATEWLWMNYPPPFELHDYRYLGNSYRERERIKRKKQRWVQRLQSMPALERQAMLAAIQEAW